MKRAEEAKMSQFYGLGLPIRLHLRSDLHLARKAWHVAMGLTIALVYLSGLERGTAVLILGTILGWDLAMETARLKVPAFNDQVMKVWGPFMRSCEVNKVSGIPFYLSSTIIAIGLFPKPVAVLSILYLALGDPVASLVGILYGHKGAKMACGKTVVGTAAGVAVCALTTFIFLRSLNISDGLSALLSVVGGIAGGTAELLPFDLDDNFTIPVISGFVLWLSFILCRI